MSRTTLRPTTPPPTPTGPIHAPRVWFGWISRCATPPDWSEAEQAQFEGIWRPLLEQAPREQRRSA